MAGQGMIVHNGRTLLIGFGNPGRGDDGLGPALAERIEELDLPSVDIEVDYQLAPEHAAAVASSAAVVFVDASVSGSAAFQFERVEPRSALTFGSHSLEPQDVLGLAEAMTGRKVDGYLLGIRGFSFEPFTESLTDRAQHNLGEALAFAERFLRNAAMSHADCSRQNRPSARENCEGGR